MWLRLMPRLLLFVFSGIVSFYLLIDISHRLLNIELPHSLYQVKSIAAKLDTMTRRGTWQDYITVVFVMASIYLWQQAFSMPGSVLLNLMAGQMYGMLPATLWTSYLTAFGSVLAYFLGWMVGSPVMEIPWIQHRTNIMRDQMLNAKSSTGVFWWLLFARLFPLSPYWLINLASPFLGIPVAPFFLSTFLGSMPYNYVCVQAGQVLGELGSTSDILTLSLMAKLLLVSLISLIPVFWGKSLHAKFRGQLQQQQQNRQQRLQKDDEEM
ncbi:snare associated Golgi protein-domain-containing protein [Absidia repens]|uniref:Snare associated Golgi protein-domain-containing protein n=1 Tax=Absidia repens TaxID=90262 RepID=A0A1X2IBT4_9FUNG|nr:snare associated Golgi protein-domain-containing protein [Absidia repens]